jgi:hypothetical protein
VARKGRLTSRGDDVEEEVVLVQLASRDLVEKALSGEQRPTMKNSDGSFLAELDRFR